VEIKLVHCVLWNLLYLLIDGRPMIIKMDISYSLESQMADRSLNYISIKNKQIYWFFGNPLVVVLHCSLVLCEVWYAWIGQLLDFYFRC
jgi:hypothetical protein